MAGDSKGVVTCAKACYRQQIGTTARGRIQRMFRTIVTSVMTAVVVSVVAGTAKLTASNAISLYRLRMHAPEMGLIAVAWDPVSVLHDRTLWSVSLVSLVLVFSYCFRRLSRRRELPLFLSAAVFSFVAIGLITMLLLGWAALLSPQTPDRLKVALLLGLLAGTYIGDFGFLAGIAGGFCLDRRKRQIRSTKRLLLESAAVGAVLGALFPLYYLATYMTGRVNTAMAAITELFCLTVGSSCAVLFAVAFRRRLTAAAT